MVLNGRHADGEILAANTTESLRIVRRGEWVYKYLKPLDSFPLQYAADRLRQIRLRVRESLLHDELNPLVYDEPRNCLVSRFRAGRLATIAESLVLADSFRRSRRGYLLDITAGNIVVTDGWCCLVDFLVEERHPDWAARESAHCAGDHMPVTFTHTELRDALAY